MSIVKNFMSATPLTLPIRATLEEAEKIFVEKRITALPVVDAGDRIVGVLTDFILVKMFLRKASIKSANTSGMNVQFFADELDPVVTIEENEPIASAFKKIVQSPNHRIFALDAEGKLSGALSPKDIIPFLAGDNSPKPPKFDSEILAAKAKIQELMAELEAEKAQTKNYFDFFDRAPFMLHAMDFKGNVIMANKMAHLILGYEPGEMVGMSLTQLYPYHLHNQVREALVMIRATGFNPLVSSMMVKKDTSLMKVDVASMLRRDANGIPISTISVSRPTEGGNMMDFLRAAAFHFRTEDLEGKTRED